MMRILTSFNSIHDAQEAQNWLTSHGIAATIEGKSAHGMNVYIPNGVGLYVTNTDQFQAAKRQLRAMDLQRHPSSAGDQPVIEKLKAKRLDKVAVVAATIAIAIFVIWLVASVVV